MWAVQIYHEGRRKHIGYFAAEQEEAAARAYDDKARQLRGSEAHSSKFKLNFPTAKEQMNQLAPAEPRMMAKQPPQTLVQQTGACVSNPDASMWEDAES